MSRIESTLRNKRPAFYILVILLLALIVLFKENVSFIPNIERHITRYKASLFDEPRTASTEGKREGNLLDLKLKETDDCKASKADSHSAPSFLPLRKAKLVWTQEGTIFFNRTFIKRAFYEVYSMNIKHFLKRRERD